MKLAASVSMVKRAWRAGGILVLVLICWQNGFASGTTKLHSPYWYLDDKTVASLEITNTASSVTCSKSFPPSPTRCLAEVGREPFGVPAPPH